MVGSNFFALFLQHLQLFVFGGLFSGLLHEVSESLAFHDFVIAEDLIKVFFQFLTSPLNIFRVLVGDSEEFFLWKLGSA